MTSTAAVGQIWRPRFDARSECALFFGHLEWTAIRRIHRRRANRGQRRHEDAHEIDRARPACKYIRLPNRLEVSPRNHPRHKRCDQTPTYEYPRALSSHASFESFIHSLPQERQAGVRAVTELHAAFPDSVGERSTIRGRGRPSASIQMLRPSQPRRSVGRPRERKDIPGRNRTRQVRFLPKPAISACRSLLKKTLFCRDFLLVEAAGIEPASADAPDRASTSVVRLESHPTAGGERPTGGPAILWMSRLGRLALPWRRARWLAPLPWPRAQPGGASLASQMTRQRLRDLNDSHLCVSRWINEANRGPRLATQPENRPRRNQVAPVCHFYAPHRSRRRPSAIVAQSHEACAAGPRGVGCRDGHRSTPRQGRGAPRAPRPGRPLLLLNAWDAASAAVIARAGAQAIATTSAGAANALGYADGQRAHPRARCSRPSRRSPRAVDLPVTADMEAGYGDAPEDAAATARGVLEAGAVGLNLEDTCDERRRATAPDRAVRRQDRRRPGGRRPRRASRSSSTRAPTSSSAQVGDPATRLERAVERGRAYLDAGADCIFVPGRRRSRRRSPRSSRGSAGRSASSPCPGSPTLAELAALGVARISVGSGAYRAALALAQRIAEEAYGAGSLDAMIAAQVPFADAQALFEQLTPDRRRGRHADRNRTYRPTGDRSGRDACRTSQHAHTRIWSTCATARARRSARSSSARATPSTCCSSPRSRRATS